MFDRATVAIAIETDFNRGNAVRLEMQQQQRFHRGYADMVRKSNYSDIFLVDLNGDVVYSVTKQANFATNLLSGPYQSSGLGNTFAKIKRRLDGGQGFDSHQTSATTTLRWVPRSITPSSLRIVAFTTSPFFR